MLERLQSRRFTASAILAVLGAGNAVSQPAVDSAVLTEVVCKSPSLAATVPADRIGEPVSAVVLESPTWMAASQDAPAHCLVTGRLQPLDTSSTAQPIRFAVALPATW